MEGTRPRRSWMDIVQETIMNQSREINWNMAKDRGKWKGK